MPLGFWYWLAYSPVQHGPQKIAKHGRTTAVVVAAEEWERKAERQGNLAEFLASSPLRGSGLKIKRLPMRLRNVEL